MEAELPGERPHGSADASLRNEWNNRVPWEQPALLPPPRLASEQRVRTPRAARELRWPGQNTCHRWGVEELGPGHGLPMGLTGSSCEGGARAV